MLKLDLPPSQKTRQPPAPAFSAPFSSPTLKWARRKRHGFSNALPHSRSRSHGQGRRASSPSPDPPSTAGSSPNHSHSPSLSHVGHRNKAPPRKPSKEDEDDNDSGGDAVRPEDNGSVVRRKGLGKPIILALAAAPRGDGNGAASAAAQHLAGAGVGEGRSLRPRGGARQRRVELWVSLSRDEIEEDYYSITGGRLPRRPKRRPRALPPNLADRIFPGSWLPNTIMAEMYKVHDPAESRRR